MMRGMEHDFERLDEALRLTPALSPELFGRVAEHCTRLSSLRQSGKAIELDRMIEADAWTDAAIALIAFEQPNWSIRRIVCEDGEWHCSLSRQPNLPLDLDDMAEASHEVLPLAVLRAFVAARTRDAVAPQAVSATPRIRPASNSFVFCSDNYA
jgi:hypothetical protein